MTGTFDTGILVRATPVSTGPTKRLVESVSDNPNHEIILSEFILGEVGRVLAYPRMQKLLGLSGDDIHAYVAELRVRCWIIDPMMGWPIVLNDPNDDPIVYTAITGKADVLCALDRDLHAPNVVAFCKSHGIAVMTDLELLQLLR